MNNLNIYKLDAHTLRVFLKVCELQSVSRAAEHFDLNQSTVSNILDRLHQMLGYKLFEKAGRNIVPTENAKSLIPRAERIVSAIEGLPETGEYDPFKDTRPVTIAANLNSMMGVLAAFRDALWKICPDRHVRFLELGSRDQMEETLSSGKADFIIGVRTPKYPPSFAYEKLFEDVSVVFYDATQIDAPSTIEKYFAAKHGVLDFGGSTRSVVENELRRLQGHRQIVCSASNVSVLAAMMKGTSLVASMPSHLRNTVMTEFSWCELGFLNQKTLIFDLIWHKRNTDSSRHKWLLDIFLSLDLKSELDL